MEPNLFLMTNLSLICIIPPMVYYKGPIFLFIISMIYAMPVHCLLPLLRGFVKLKKFQKSEKNSEVGGWFQAVTRIFTFWGKFCGFFRVFCAVFMFPNKHLKLDSHINKM